MHAQQAQGLMETLPPNGKPPGLCDREPRKVSSSFLISEPPGLERSQVEPSPPTYSSSQEPALLGPTPDSIEDSQLQAHMLFQRGLQISSQAPAPEVSHISLQPDTLTEFPASEAPYPKVVQSQLLQSMPDDEWAQHASMHQSYASQDDPVWGQCDMWFGDPSSMFDATMATEPGELCPPAYGDPAWSEPFMASNIPAFDTAVAPGSVAGSSSSWDPHGFQARAAPARPPRGKRGRGPATGPQAKKKPKPPVQEERTMPEASEEDWKRRIEHRTAAVEYIQTTNQYQRFSSDREKGVEKEHTDRPQTPDPEDRTVSKRDWEKSVQRWRMALQQW